MKLPISISKLSAQLNLTSRTLRHWESEGLFTSNRDSDTGWRSYDEEAVVCIQLTALLRQLDIPIKDIKLILELKTIKTIEHTFSNRLMALKQKAGVLNQHVSLLQNYLCSLSALEKQQVDSSLIKLSNCLHQIVEQDKTCDKESSIMNNINKINATSHSLSFIRLPSMRTIYHIAVGTSPEDDAMTPVIEWLESQNLLGTARLFGGNVNPFPSKKNPTYGYGICASIPQGVEVPKHLKEMDLPGGIYAMMPSSDDVEASWKLLMQHLSKNTEYTSDRSRLCLEEHIRNANPTHHSSQYMLTLLEPVKKIKTK